MVLIIVFFTNMYVKFLDWQTRVMSHLSNLCLSFLLVLHGFSFVLIWKFSSVWLCICITYKHFCLCFYFRWLTLLHRYNFGWSHGKEKLESGKLGMWLCSKVVLVLDLCLMWKEEIPPTVWSEWIFFFFCVKNFPYSLDKFTYAEVTWLYYLCRPLPLYLNLCIFLNSFTCTTDKFHQKNKLMKAHARARAHTHIRFL